MSDKKTVELELALLHDTGRAYLVTDGDSEAWLPKSLVESMEETGDLDEKDNPFYTFTVPEWLAMEKGLV